ncbi:uncharacterized protein LOC121760230 isoform X2 [Salvia splendens]|uniref:uncharacterized protein LOC121760230 isoform X2 n=1 Tax=Salvia splendens TaxID=180675 RepID=UPI001C26F6C5|nr:uncharacterized protein LOC121760230 isoform X2 [Salvia splendens]
MGWSYPEIAIEDLMTLIKNYIDMLILASGYQSTGRLAIWDSNNINRSLQWALFLENVMKALLSSADYEESVEELDALLHELTLDPNFPQGLAHLSCVTLVRAKDLMLEHLIHTFPLRESHLKAITTASVEMDISNLKRRESNGLDIYLEKLMLLPSNGPNLNESRNFEEHDDWGDGDFSVTTIQKLGIRQSAVSCSTVAEAGLENIWKTLRKKMHDELGSTSNSEPLKQSTIGEELPLESDYWNRWRARSLSYMLDKRTIRMISGASLIFSAPEGQWTQVLERLNLPAQNDGISEMIELLLLGCVVNKWSALLEHLMSVSYEFPAISKLYHEVISLPPGKSQNFCQNEGLMNSKEKSVVDCLEVLLSSKVNQLWQLPPVLAATAIPSWSKLFRSYLHELEGQLIGNSLATSCLAGTLEHRECLINSIFINIRALYLFII